MQTAQSVPAGARKVVVNETSSGVLWFVGIGSSGVVVANLANDWWQGMGIHWGTPILCTFVAIVSFSVSALIKRVLCSECGNKVTPESKLCPTCEARF